MDCIESEGCCCCEAAAAFGLETSWELNPEPNIGNWARGSAIEIGMWSE